MSTKQQKVAAGVSYWQVFRMIFVVFSFYLVGDALYRWNGFRYYSTFSEFLPSVALIAILWTFIALLTSLLIWLLLKMQYLLLLLCIYILLHLARWTKSELISLIQQVVSEGWEGSWYYAWLLKFLPSIVVVSFFWIIIAVLIAFVAWFSLRSFQWICCKIGWNQLVKDFFLILFILILFVSLIWFVRKLPIYNEMGNLIQIIETLFISIVLTWKLRSKAERWMDIVQSRYSVWFGIVQDRITIWVFFFGIIVILSVPLVAYRTWGGAADKAESFEIAQSNVSVLNRPNIILVTFDGMASADMSAYGYVRPTTPFISTWAKKASLFTRAKTSSCCTAPATTSLMTGRRVWTHGVFQRDGYKINKLQQNLPLLLRQNGYYNMAYIGSTYAMTEKNGLPRYFNINPSSVIFRNDSPMIFNIWLQFIDRIDTELYKLFGKDILLYNWIIKQDFIFGKFLIFVNEKIILKGKHVDNLTLFPYSYNTEKVFNKLLDDMGNNPQEPFFAWLHIWAPHEPYIAPDPYKGIFESSLKLNGENETTEEKYLTLRARYDELIRDCDKQFEKFINNLSLKDKLKNTVVILSTDHGNYLHFPPISFPNYYLTEPHANIPLIIKEPDRGGEIINDLVEQIDISATILDLAHIPVPAWMEGRSLVPLMRNKRLPSKPVFSLYFEGNPSNTQITKGNITLWDGDYKLNYNIDNNKSILVNLKMDPEEKKDLFYKEPAEGQRLLSLIKHNLDEINETIITREDK